MAGRATIEIVGARPWPIGLLRALPRRSAVPVQVLITPQPHARTSIAELRGHKEVVVWAQDSSAVEAAVLIAAGANAYVTQLGDLAAAVRAVSTGETWLAPVAAAAVSRLARSSANPAFTSLSAAARAAAAGQPWPLACRSIDLRHTQSLLQQLRLQL